MKDNELTNEIELQWEKFYSKVLSLYDEINIEIPELQLYLQSMYKVLDKYKLQAPSLELFYKIIKDSFFEKPIEFDDGWLK